MESGTSEEVVPSLEDCDLARGFFSQLLPWQLAFTASHILPGFVWHSENGDGPLQNPLGPVELFACLKPQYDCHLDFLLRHSMI